MISQPVSPFFPVLQCPLRLDELQACPLFPDVVFPFVPLSVLSSSIFHCALQDGFCQTWWTGDMTIPLQFAYLYDGQVFIWSDRLLDLGTDYLVDNIVFVWDAYYLAVAPHFIATRGKKSWGSWYSIGLNRCVGEVSLCWEWCREVWRDWYSGDKFVVADSGVGEISIWWQWCRGDN